VDVVFDTIEHDYPNTHKAIQNLVSFYTSNNNTKQKTDPEQETEFQQELEEILAKSGVLDPQKPASATKRDRKPLPQYLKKNDMEHLSSNLWEKTQAF
jgi:hypothetical protein